MLMKKGREGDCSSCAERFFCKELCPAAELYVNQDFVRMREMPRGLLKPRRFPQVDEKPNLTKTEIKILRYLLAGLTKTEIAEALNISSNSVYVHVHNLKKKGEKY